MTTLLGPAVVLVALFGTLWIVLDQPDQPDQPATTRPPSRRAPRPSDAVAGTPSRRGPTPGTVAAAGPMPGAMPSSGGLPWLDAPPTPRVRSGFALMVILAAVGFMLAAMTAGAVVGATVAVRSALG